MENLELSGRKNETRTRNRTLSGTLREKFEAAQKPGFQGRRDLRE